MFQPRFYYDGLREDRVLSGFLDDETRSFPINDKACQAPSVTGAECESLKITWKNGGHIFTIDMAAGGSPLCSKTTVLAGDWTVTVGDTKGNLLKEMSFKVK